MLPLLCPRGSICLEIHALVGLLDRRLASVDRQIDILFDLKGRLVRSDRRARTAAIVTRAASAAAQGESNTFYAELKLLRPWKARQTFMIKQVGRNHGQDNNRNRPPLGGTFFG